MSRAASGSGAGRDGGGEERRQRQQQQQRCQYKGVRRRAWGKWVSEIRVPGTRERLWLGSYASPEAAAVAHDAAACLLLRRAGRAVLPHHRLNFSGRAAACCYHVVDAYHRDLSPRSVQRVASDAGMAADAQIVHARAALVVSPPDPDQQAAIIGAPQDVGLGATAQGAAYAPPPPPPCCNGASSTSSWTAPSASGSSSAGNEQPLVYGDITVDDIEILI